MSRLSTLPAPLKELLKCAPLLQASDEVRDEWRYSSVDINEMVRSRMSRQLADEVRRVVVFEEDCGTGFEFATKRITARVYAFNEAELAVLLTRAYEAGRRG